MRDWESSSSHLPSRFHLLPTHTSLSLSHALSLARRSRRGRRVVGDDSISSWDSKSVVVTFVRQIVKPVTSRFKMIPPSAAALVLAPALLLPVAVAWAPSTSLGCVGIRTSSTLGAPYICSNKIPFAPPPHSWTNAIVSKKSKRCSDPYGDDVPPPDSLPEGFTKYAFPHSFVTSLLCALICFGTFTFSSSQAVASDEVYSDAVENAIRALRSAAGSSEKTFQAYENIAAIITEGKGVGGSINYKGVQLERGYVADEDTSIYNPGLTLMTESEKLNLVEAVIQSRRDCINTDWSDDTQLAYDFLREKLDPLHMVELRGYLGIFPFYAAAVYATVLAVQQLVRGLFPAAYFVGVFAIVAPALALVALGPR